jgi:hypothetical protein
MNITCIRVRHSAINDVVRPSIFPFARSGPVKQRLSSAALGREFKRARPRAGGSLGSITCVGGASIASNAAAFTAAHECHHPRFRSIWLMRCGGCHPQHSDASLERHPPQPQAARELERRCRVTPGSPWATHTHAQRSAQPSNRRPHQT